MDATPPKRVGIAVALGALTCAAAACGGPVNIPEPNPDPEIRRICEQVVNNLPPTVLDAPQRDTTGTISAAWGEPLITLTCGIDKPAAMQTDTRCFEVNGVGWFAQEGEGGMIFTTIGRAVNVQVGIPDTYSPEADGLVDLAQAMDANPEYTPCL